MEPHLSYSSDECLMSNFPEYSVIMSRCAGAVQDYCAYPPFGHDPAEEEEVQSPGAKCHEVPFPGRRARAITIGLGAESLAMSRQQSGLIFEWRTIGADR